MTNTLLPSIDLRIEPRGTRHAAIIECPMCGLTRELAVTFATPRIAIRVGAKVAAAHAQRHGDGAVGQ